MTARRDPVNVTRRLLLAGVVPAALFAFLVVRSAASNDWPGVAIFGGFLGVYIVMIAWRLRSGIPTWSFLATIVGLLTRIRPTRAGLVRKGRTEPFPYRERPVTEGFDSLARRLHAEVEPSGQGTDSPAPAQGDDPGRNDL